MQATDICKSYTVGSRQLNVLKGIDLTVTKGEILAVIGPSGAGKSTLLHILGALDRPDRGRVILAGQPIFQLSDLQLAQIRNQHIGFVFQFHHLLPEFSALENVMMPGLIARRERTHLKKQAKALLNRVGLSQREDHRPNELSGGEQQRVAVARALVNDPQLVLADEPSGNLDQHTSQALHDLLWDLSRTDLRSFIIVTHDPRLAERADRTVELIDGQIVRETYNTISTKTHEKNMSRM
ncbi:MAG: ABC transporter ATP-binding protein [Gemmatimonadetes bacterium]|nr:MAG: ABC transporter ATP-binding protein [Gemmatimonadota bacterium]